jgi:hypothetical protein
VRGERLRVVAVHAASHGANVRSPGDSALAPAQGSFRNTGPGERRRSHSPPLGPLARRGCPLDRWSPSLPRPGSPVARGCRVGWSCVEGRRCGFDRPCCSTAGVAAGVGGGVVGEGVGSAVARGIRWSATSGSPVRGGWPQIQQWVALARSRARALRWRRVDPLLTSQPRSGQATRPGRGSGDAR